MFIVSLLVNHYSGVVVFTHHVEILQQLKPGKKFFESRVHDVHPIKV